MFYRFHSPMDNGIRDERIGFDTSFNQNYKNKDLFKVFPVNEPRYASLKMQSAYSPHITTDHITPSHPSHPSSPSEAHSAGIMGASFYGIPLVDTAFATTVAYVASTKFNYNPLLAFAGAYIAMRGAMLAMGSIDSSHFLLN